MYLNIDNIQIISDPENIIRDSLEVYQQYVLGTSFREVEEEIFVFIDEIQKLDEWASTLKYYTDTYSNLKFVATGSVSTLIEQDASETLIGRISDQVIMPMKFVDVLEYREVFEDDELLEASTSLREALQTSIIEEDYGPISTELTAFFGTNENKVPEVRAEMNRYLLKGGYPGVLDDELTDAYAALDQGLKYTVTGDLANVFDITKPEKALQILSLLVESTTSKLNVQNVAQTAEIGRDTVERYLDYLSEFFLISECSTYTTSEYKTGGRPKMYLQDVGLYNTLAGTMHEETLRDSQKLGPILETAMCDHCRRLQFYLSEHQNANVSYWDRRGQVDFMLDGTGTPLPIEVKNGDTTREDLRGLRNFVEETDAPFGLAINNSGELKQGDNVLHVPYWLFLLLC
jgi:predicted AAA+ superfamily ATPase